MSDYRILIGVKDQPDWDTQDAVVIQFDLDVILNSIDALRESDCFDGALLKYHPVASWAQDALNIGDYGILSWLTGSFFDEEKAIDYDTIDLDKDDPIIVDDDLLVSVVVFNDGRFKFQIDADGDGTYDTYELLVEDGRLELVHWDDATEDYDFGEPDEYA